MSFPNDRWPDYMYDPNNSSATMLHVETDDDRYLFKLGDGPILITDGYGGWEEVDRPSNKPMSRWDGAGLIKLKIPLMFDAFAVRRSIGWNVDQALALGRVGDGSERPPVFSIDGDAVPSGMRRRRWVMNESPEIGTIRRNRDGVLIHEEMTITIMEFSRPDRIDFTKLPKKIRKVVVKKDDTVNKIARRLFKKKSKNEIRKWATAIAELNNIRDKNKKLKAGRKLKIPNDNKPDKGKAGKK